MDIFNNPELKVNAIRIKLKLIRIGIHNLNLAVALGCEVMSSPHFYSDVMPDIEGQQLFAEISINGAKGAAYSSSIVYAHAMCETILMDVCQLIRMKEPEAWDFYLVNKKVSFSDIVLSIAQLMRSVPILSRSFLKIYRKSHY